MSSRAAPPVSGPPDNLSSSHPSSALGNPFPRARLVPRAFQQLSFLLGFSTSVSRAPAVVPLGRAQASIVCRAAPASSSAFVPFPPALLFESRLLESAATSVRSLLPFLFAFISFHASLAAENVGCSALFRGDGCRSLDLRHLRGPVDVVTRSARDPTDPMDRRESRRRSLQPPSIPPSHSVSRRSPSKRTRCPTPRGARQLVSA